MAEEIALVSDMIQTQDNDVFIAEEHHHRSDNIQNSREKLNVFNRIFNSKKSFKQFLLWMILFLCLFLISGPLALHISYSVPKIKTRDVAAHVFSEERARDNLINLTQYGSRVGNTRGKFDARKFLISKLEQIYLMSERNLQFKIYLQNFTDSAQCQAQNIFVHVSNALAENKSVSSLMLTAHYDSVEFSPGGSDDGSGVVILLELLSNLIHDLTITFSDVHLIVLFTDGEEIGLNGATYFLGEHFSRYHIHRFINVDSVGCKQVASLIQSKPSQLVIDYGRVSRPRANVILGNICRWLGITTDYDMYALYGSASGYNFGFFVDGYTYHTQLDDLLSIKQGVLQELGENLVTLTRNILMDNVHQIDNDPLIYFDILGRYLITYKMSTSIFVQGVLIILIIIISIILIILDHLYHRHQSFQCINSRCIYSHLKDPLMIRIILIIIYSISNFISVLIGSAFSLLIAVIMSGIHPFSWFGNPILAILLFSFPCFIGFITIGYLSNLFHRLILRKSSQNTRSTDINIETLNEISFDFEQNLSIVLIYGCLMMISIVLKKESLYIILIWSIFICPIYLLLMIIEFIFHWKKISSNFLEDKSYWLYIPLLISLLPLTHTIEILNRLLRILIPIIARKFLVEWSFHENRLICGLIIIPTILFALLFIPILQRIKYFARILIISVITFLIIFIFAAIRQPFTNIHPHTFHAQHISNTIFNVDRFNVSLISQSSEITVLTFSNRALSPLLEEFSMKSGHILHNQHCSSRTNCTFDDTFNRKIAVNSIKIESMNNSVNYTIVVQHVLSYNIQISSLSLIKFDVRNEFKIPRTETIIDVTLNSSLYLSMINIQIRRCDLMDSPFLLLFTRLMTDTVPMGDAYCHAIEDNTMLIFNQNTLFN